MNRGFPQLNWLLIDARANYKAVFLIFSRFFKSLFFIRFFFYTPKSLTKVATFRGQMKTVITSLAINLKFNIIYCIQPILLCVPSSDVRLSLIVRQLIMFPLSIHVVYNIY